eukprot:g8889.t1
MSESIVIDEEQKLVINEVNNVPTFVLNSLRDGAKIGDCSALALVSRVLSGICLEYGLEPVGEIGVHEDSSHSSSRQTWEMSFTIPEPVFLPQTNTTNHASLVFLCVVMRHYIFVYCSARVAKSGEMAYSVSAASTNIHIPFYVTRTNAKIEVSNLHILMEDLRSKICAPSLAVAAYEIGRSLKLALPSLPDEIMQNILGRLDLTDTLSLGLTCHTLLSVTSRDSVWDRLFRFQFQLDPIEDWNGDESMKSCFVREWNKRNRPIPAPQLRTLFRRGPRPLWIHRRSERVTPPFLRGVGDDDRLPFTGFQGTNYFRSGPPLPPWRLS